MPGIRYKAYVKNKQRIRVVEFSDKCNKAGWYVNGHAGYVLKGNIAIDFNGKVLKFKAGDGLFIPQGKSHKHKAKIPRGKKAVLILFENVK